MGGMRIRIGKAGLAGLALCVTLLAACDSGSGKTTVKANPQTAQQAQQVNATIRQANVSIPRGQDVFLPFITPVQPQTRVTWQNGDSVAHSFATTPDHNDFLNPAQVTLTAPANGNATYTFVTPGIYHFYDTSKAAWNAVTHRVVAQKKAASFPLAMEQVIWVQGAISKVPETVTNPIPSGHDEFSSEFLAVQTGGTMAWFNADTDVHVVALASGWSPPVNPAPISVGGVDGTNDAPPNGGTKAVQLGTSGLYYYFCSAHADLDPATHRAKAHADASDYPTPMEGFVLVIG